MFMKIFTVLIISFNNIFTIPPNINNDEITTQSPIRNKRQNNQIYRKEVKLKNLKEVEIENILLILKISIDNLFIFFCKWVIFNLKVILYTRKRYFKRNK